MQSNECSSYRQFDAVCKDGFIQNPGCNPQPCHGCGRPSPTIPNCLKDELPDVWVNEDGSPLFYSGERRDGAERGSDDHA